MREDYSADGDAWAYLPHDHARSRAYRWGEDGMAGFSDVEQRLCLGLALWNGRDPILKERMFGLTGAQANHGEDVKEYWWYLDAVPSHAWNRWRYHYPQAAYPYDDLLAENGRRGKLDAEYELLDTGVFDEDRYWIVEVDYVKADPTDVIMVIRATNAGPDADTLHVLPTVWFRNTWSWDVDAPKPRLATPAPTARCRSATRSSASSSCWVAPGVDGSVPRRCSARTRRTPRGCSGRHRRHRSRRTGSTTTSSHGAATVNPRAGGHQGVVLVPARTSPAARPPRCGSGCDRRAPSRSRPRRSARTSTTWSPCAERRPTSSTPRCHPPASRPSGPWSCARPSPGCSGASSCTPTTCERWLDGDPTQPPPPPSRRLGRNARWSNFDAFDIMSMPDKWEYPWFAAWDLGFHCVALAHVDPAFAKYQLLLLCREWFQHPNGALPAYEWDFGDVNPPVQAWAALEVFAIDGAATSTSSAGSSTSCS